MPRQVNRMNQKILDSPKINLTRGQSNTINGVRTDYNPDLLNKQKVSDLRNLIKMMTGLEPTVRTSKKELRKMVETLTNVQKPKSITKVNQFINKLNKRDVNTIPVKDFINEIKRTDVQVSLIKQLLSKYVILFRENIDPQSGTRVFKISSEEQLKKIIEQDYDVSTDSEQYLKDILENEEVPFDLAFMTFIEKSPVSHHGAYFGFINTSEFDLSDLQIYNEEQIIDLDSQETCIINTLQYHEVDDKAIENLKSVINDIKILTDGVNTSDLTKLAQLIDVNINLKYVDNKTGSIKTRKFLCGDNNKRFIDIALYKNHYFPYIPNYIQAHHYAIKNYSLVNQLPDFKRIKKCIDGSYKRDYTTEPYINSLQVVKYLFEDNIFKQISDLQLIKLSQSYLPNNIKIDSIDTDKMCSIYNYQPNKKKEEEEEKTVFVFDTEVEHKNKTLTHIRACKIKNNISSADIIDNNDWYDDYYHEYGYFGAKIMLEKMTDKYGVEVLSKEVLKEMNEEEKKKYKTPEVILIAHFCKFDSTQIINYLTGIELIDGDGRFYNLNGYHYYNGKRLKFKCIDSYNFISTKLQSLPKMFNITAKKELMSYEFILKNNLSKNANIHKFTKNFSYDEKVLFNQLIIELGFKNNDGLTFDFNAYLDYYLIQDVNVLGISIIKFREQLFKISEELELQEPVDIFNYLTISSIAWDIVKRYGCLDGVGQTKNLLAQYINQFIIGGRCITKDNEIQLRGIVNKTTKYPTRMAKKFITKDDNITEFDKQKERINKYIEKEYDITPEKCQELYNNNDYILDVDCNSQYPSAIIESGGFVLGSPIKLNDDQLNIDFLQEQTTYIVVIKITKINKPKHMPLLCVKSGTNKWSNEIGIYKVDKTGLEDLIEFCEIEYEILEGFYWNKGRNSKVCELVDKLYDRRDELKSQGNALQNVYKLILNSIYGKSYQKAHPYTSKIIKGEDNLINYIKKHFNKYVSHIEIGRINNDKKYQLYALKLKHTTFNYKSFSIIGVEILSISKRIMNRVICLGEDYGADIYYQDTDSMHMTRNDWELIKNLYNQKYNTNIEGKKLLQFSSDFNSNKLTSGYEIFSVQSIIIDKKTYIDVLTTEVDMLRGVYDYHVKSKGIKLTSLERFCKDNEIDVDKLYFLLANNKYRFVIDLLKGVSSSGQDINNANFLTRNFRNEIIKEFSRTIKLKSLTEEEEEEVEEKDY